MDMPDTAVPVAGMISCTLVERLAEKYRKQHKCHRNILDQEGKVLDDCLKLMKVEASVVT